MLLRSGHLHISPRIFGTVVEGKERESVSMKRRMLQTWNVNRLDQLRCTNRVHREGFLATNPIESHPFHGFVLKKRLRDIDGKREINRRTIRSAKIETDYDHRVCGWVRDGEPRYNADTATGKSMRPFI